MSDIEHYVIEKGIPIPKQSYRLGLKDTISSMEIGDSVVIRAPQKVQVFTAAKRLGFKMITRTIDENKIRVWRVENKKARKKINGKQHEMP